MDFARTTTSSTCQGRPEPGRRAVAWRPPFDKSSSQAYTEILFLPARNLKQEKWTGPKLGPENPQATSITGFDRVANLDTLSAELASCWRRAVWRFIWMMPDSGEQNSASNFLDWARRTNTLPYAPAVAMT